MALPALRSQRKEAYIAQVKFGSQQFIYTMPDQHQSGRGDHSQRDKRHPLPQAVSQQGSRHLREADPRELPRDAASALQVYHQAGPVQPFVQGAVHIPGGAVPAERGDADGVGVVAAQREAQRDGGLVRAGARLLHQRRARALGRPVPQAGGTGECVLRPGGGLYPRNEMVGWCALGHASSTSDARAHWDDLCHRQGEQPINVPTAGAQAFPMDGIGRSGHDPPRGPSADRWVLTTANAAGTDGLTYLPKHGGARDSKFLVTHPKTDHCESCLTSTIAAERAGHLRHRAPPKH
ncbi:hypothetical protein evm_013725 [Chilo suppressalis]|nr:hypothetical protein evm_013725 [Chilo suppressalis]